MLSMLKIIKKIFLLSLFFLTVNCDQSSQSKNSANNMVIVKVFSSLTCPHCADFHLKIYEELEKEYISVGKVKFEHHSFPLDLSALNAEKILQCDVNSQINFKFLTEIYKKQTQWAAGSDIKTINNSIKVIGKKFTLTEDKMNKCLADKNLEEKILNERIEAQKNYKINSTPTIYINKKKYKGSRDYKSFKKAIEKIL
jgi:protein-disulfide isomerase